MVPFDYVPPYTIPAEPYFCKWAFKYIIDLDLHPDINSDPGESESEQILRDLWNTQEPQDQVNKVIFRPREPWYIPCSKCNCNSLHDYDNPFLCKKCSDALIEFSKVIETRIALEEAEKARKKAEHKKSAKIRLRTKKALEKLPGQGKIDMRILKERHGLLEVEEDPFYQEGDPYKSQNDHQRGLRAIDGIESDAVPF